MNHHDEEEEYIGGEVRDDYDMVLCEAREFHAKFREYTDFYFLFGLGARLTDDKIVEFLDDNVNGGV